MASDDNAPRPTSELDQSLRKIANQASVLQRASFVALAIVVAALTAAVIALMFRDLGDERRIASSCQIWRLVGGLPVVSRATPKTPQTSREGLTLILGAREAFAGQQCTGRLPKPSSGFLYLERLYRM